MAVLQAPEDRPAMDSIIATLDKIGAHSFPFNPLQSTPSLTPILIVAQASSQPCFCLLWLCAEREHNELTNTILDEVRPPLLTFQQCVLFLVFPRSEPVVLLRVNWVVLLVLLFGFSASTQRVTLFFQCLTIVFVSSP